MCETGGAHVQLRHRWEWTHALLTGSSLTLCIIRIHTQMAETTHILILKLFFLFQCGFSIVPLSAPMCSDFFFVFSCVYFLLIQFCLHWPTRTMSAIIHTSTPTSTSTHIHSQTHTYTHSRSLSLIFFNLLVIFAIWNFILHNEHTSHALIDWSIFFSFSRRRLDYRYISHISCLILPFPFTKSNVSITWSLRSFDLVRERRFDYHWIGTEKLGLAQKMVKPIPQL